MNRTQGFTLIEALISMALIAFVVVSILNGFINQQLTTKHTTGKNIAVSLIENKFEELLKFPASELISQFTVPGVETDYFVFEGGMFKHFPADPNLDDQFKRVTEMELNGPFVDITVTVHYGRRGNTYPFSVRMSTRRGG